MKSTRYFISVLALIVLLSGCGAKKESESEDENKANANTSTEISQEYIDQNLVEEDPTSYLGISIRAPKDWSGYVNFETIVPYYVRDKGEDFSPYIIFDSVNSDGTIEEFIDTYLVDTKAYYAQSNFELVKQEPFTTGAGILGQKISAKITVPETGNTQVLYIYIFGQYTTSTTQEPVGDVLVVMCSDLESNADQASKLFDASVSTIKTIEPIVNADNPKYSPEVLDEHLGDVYTRTFELSPGYTAPTVSFRAPKSYTESEKSYSNHSILFVNPSSPDYQANISYTFSTFPSHLSLLSQARVDLSLQKQYYEKVGFKILRVRSFETADGVSVAKLVTSYNEKGYNGTPVEIFQIHYLIGSNFRQPQEASGVFFEYELDISCKASLSTIEETEKLCDMSASTIKVVK